MTDYLVKLARNGLARRVVKGLKLPVPLPVTLARGEGPWVPEPLLGRTVAVGIGPGAQLGPALGASTLGAGARVRCSGDEARAQPYRDAGHEYDRPVIVDVSLEVASGRIVGLLGPNGAGKTTCFYMIVGLVPQDAGQIFVDDREITRLPMHGRARAGIGYLPQEPSVFRKLSVRDNILAILQTRKDLSGPARKEKLEALLQEFHIGHLRDAVGMSLSGGERRRVEIARALALEPKFILLDEPFAGVDPISVNDIKMIVRHLRDKGIGVLITDHNVRETLDICETAYIVGEGRVIANGTAAEILADPLVRETYLGEEFTL